MGTHNSKFSNIVGTQHQVELQDKTWGMWKNSMFSWYKLDQITGHIHLYGSKAEFTGILFLNTRGKNCDRGIVFKNVTWDGSDFNWEQNVYESN